MSCRHIVGWGPQNLKKIGCGDLGREEVTGTFEYLIKRQRL